jgi:hypothetical protein
MAKKVKSMKMSCPTKGGCGGCAYFLGFLGSAIYFVSTATGFWNGVLGVLKSLVWPAFLVFEALQFLAA